MYAAIPGSIFELPFWQTYLANAGGGIFGATIFFFSSELFIKINHNKKVKREEAAIAAGKPVVHKKRFTKTNRMIIRMKWKLGIIGITFYAPLFLSIPIGTIITAKFYNKQKLTYPLIILGILINGLLTSGIPYIWN